MRTGMVYFRHLQAANGVGVNTTVGVNIVGGMVDGTVNHAQLCRPEALSQVVMYDAAVYQLH